MSMNLLRSLLLVLLVPLPIDWRACPVSAAYGPGTQHQRWNRWDLSGRDHRLGHISQIDSLFPASASTGGEEIWDDSSHLGAAGSWGEIGHGVGI